MEKEAALALMSLLCGCGSASPVRNGPTDAATAEDVAGSETRGACPPQANCPMPSGPCTSQADCGGDADVKLFFCKPAVCGGAGACSPVPRTCPEVFDPVCGCDSRGYTNSCFAQWGGVGVAYGGGCRSGAIVSCGPDQPCPSGQLCTDDPTAACDGGAGCPGICLSMANSNPCGDGSVAADAQVPSSCDSMTQACVQTQIDTCPAADCGHCAFTTGASCDADTPCGAPGLCIPSVGCGDAGGCPSYCVVP